MPLAAQELRTYFVTTVCAGRSRPLQSTASASLFVDVLQENRAKHRFDLHAYVVMPNHVHLLLTPAYELSLEKVMQFIKGGFSFRHKLRGVLWEQGYFDERIANALSYQNCVRYIEMNPVEAGLSHKKEDWPFSSVGKNLDAMPQWMQKAQG